MSRAIIGHFWTLITYVGLAIATGQAIDTRPALLAEPRGWLMLALAITFAVWYSVGYRWFAGADVGTLDKETQAALLRVGMEALANAERHAHARALTLTLAREGCEVALRVRDDGVGILAKNALEARKTQPVAVGMRTGANNEIAAITGATSAHAEIASPPGHYGITGMRERILACGGRFTIGPTRDASRVGGTLVEARIPADAH